MDEAMTMLDEYKGGHNTYPVAHDVVDRFVEKYESSPTPSDSAVMSGRNDLTIVPFRIILCILRLMISYATYLAVTARLLQEALLIRLQE